MPWNLATGLENKGVMVTGAAGGIGRAVAEAFAAAGSRVCAVDLKKEAVDAVVAELESPDLHLAVGFDLSDIKAQAGLFASMRQHFGRADVLVHVAAVLIRRNDVMEITEEDWDKQVDVNLKATYFLNIEAAKTFKAQGQGGRIINFTSTSWWTGGSSIALPYVASKGGVVSIGRGLARWLAKDGITVNTIAPGGIDTRMFGDRLSDEVRQAYMKEIPMGRLGQPEEVAGAAVFLASDHASYITGTIVNVSGGQLMY